MVAPQNDMQKKKKHFPYAALIKRERGESGEKSNRDAA